MNYLKPIFTLLSVVFLNGCLEVEDSNSDIQSLISSHSEVTLKGVVVDAYDSTTIASALITVNVGSETLITNFSVTAGEFELTGLPENSDIELIISSPDNKFMARTFFKETGYGSAGGISDFGSFTVSEPVDIEISVIDSSTSVAFSQLKFIANSSFGSSSSEYKYQHVSTFNEETGLYKITLPKYINTGVRANLDLDKDGEIDYYPESGNQLTGRDLYISSANSKAFSTIYIQEVVPAVDIEVRLSLVDEAAIPLLDAKLFIENKLVSSLYDELTNQYVFSAKLKNSLTVQLPAFTSGEINYQSSAFTIENSANNTFYINKQGSWSSCCFSIPSTSVIDLALTPQVLTDSATDIKVVVVADVVNPVDSSFSVFYSQAIEVAAESITLKSTSGYTVTKGDSDANDLVLPGNTIISGGIEIPVTYVLSLNDTRLKVTPMSSLIAGESYRYDIASLVNKASQESKNIDNDALSFEIEVNSSEVFDPVYIKLDNENYTTNGIAITTANTAGDVGTPVNKAYYTSLYLPNSIHSLQNLTLRKMSYMNNGISSVTVDTYNVVVDGTVKAGKFGIANLAENENVIKEGYFRHVIYSSAQAETQQVYRINTYTYLSDNTTTEINSISFEYAYETKAGEVFNGNITIPVQ